MLVKLLSIAGLFAIIVLFIWLIIQGVRMFPSAFSSLASIAETIHTYRPRGDLEIHLEKNIVNSGEAFILTWNDMGKGTYTFNYTCADEVRFSVRTDAGVLQDVACTENLTLPEGVTGLFVSVESRSQRFSEVPFQITFDPERGDNKITKGTVTVVNATVPQIAHGDTDMPKVEIPASEATSTPETPAVSTPQPAAPTPATQPKPAVPTQPASTVVALYPQSLPNGYVDLKISYLGVGRILNGVFVPESSFDEDDRAAFRFEVKNIGSKTSGEWSYDLLLPGNVPYHSDEQAPLLPNERAIFTVGFDLLESNDRVVSLKASTETANDTNSKNDSFEWSVKIVK